MEFLVAAAGEVAEKDRSRLLAEGQQEQQSVQSQPVAKWRAELPNGATVEFTGICENPSGGKSWWGPDGSPLDGAPYINYERYGPGTGGSRDLRNCLARPSVATGPLRGRAPAWRGSSAPTAMRSTTDTAIKSQSGLDAGGYAFEKSRDRTTLKIGVSVNNGPFAWVTFKNISLVPGKDMGVEIVPGDDGVQ